MAWADQRARLCRDRHHPTPGWRSTDEEVTRLRTWIDANLKVEVISGGNRPGIKRKMEIGLPGHPPSPWAPVTDRDTYNARTRKGPKKTVAGKKKYASRWPRPQDPSPSTRRPASGA